MKQVVATYSANTLPLNMFVWDYGWHVGPYDAANVSSCAQPPIAGGQWCVVLFFVVAIGKSAVADLRVASLLCMCAVSLAMEALSLTRITCAFRKLKFAKSRYSTHGSPLVFG